MRAGPNTRVRRVHRGYKRRSKRRSATTKVNKGVTLLGKSFHTRLRYVGEFLMNPLAGAVATHYLNPIGLYDPDTSGIGHQPLGFDEIMTMYEHYAVQSSNITLLVQGSTDDPLQCNEIIGVQQTNQNGGGSTQYNTWMEQPNVTWKPIGCMTGNHGSVMVKNKFNTKTFFDVKDINDQGDLKGTDSSNPNETAFWVVSAQHQNPADDGAQLYVTFVITYDVIFSEPKTLAQS